jgi:hypothetical protein
LAWKHAFIFVSVVVVCQMHHIHVFALFVGSNHLMHV